LVYFVLKAKTVFSPRFFACGAFSTFLYGNGSHSNRVTVTPDRAIKCYPLHRNSSSWLYLVVPQCAHHLDATLRELCAWAQGPQRTRDVRSQAEWNTLGHAEAAALVEAHVEVNVHNLCCVVLIATLTSLQKSKPRKR
jgi:hypothetical protein